MSEADLLGNRDWHYKRLRTSACRMQPVAASPTKPTNSVSLLPVLSTRSYPYRVRGSREVEITRSLANDPQVGGSVLPTTRSSIPQNTFFLAILLLHLLLQPLAAQDYGSRLGTVKRGGKVSFEPRGSGVLFDALDPAVRKWYIPQELYSEYQWKQWEYSNYARAFYQRYVSTSLEGSYVYDVYGNYLTRGWLIFDWRQQNPQPFGSTLAQDGRYRNWFNQLVIT